MCGGHVYPNLTQNTVGMGGIVFFTFWLGLNSLPMSCGCEVGNYTPSDIENLNLVEKNFSCFKIQSKYVVESG